MSSEIESRKGDDEDFSCGLLLRDIEEISKALYLHKTPGDAFNSFPDRQNVAAKSGTSESESDSDVIIRDSLHKDKKSSIWNWKPIKALTNTRNHRFNCCFFLHVHAIEGLPPYFNNLNLRVTWKQKPDTLRTRPSQVCLGMAEFEETLMHQCTISVGRSGPYSSAKYEPKLFLLHASVIGAPTLDIGSRWIDLTRLLPLTLEELAGDKSSSGKWTTSFKLTGKAKGAILNVSFGYSIYDGGYTAKNGGMNHFSDCDVPRMLLGGSYQQSQSAKVTLYDEIFLKQRAELSQSVTLLYQKLDEENTGNSLEYDLYHKHVKSWEPMSDLSHEFDDDDEFDIIEHGIEVPEKDQIKPDKCSSQTSDPSVIEIIDVAEIFKGEDTDFVEYIEWDSTDNHDEHEPAFDELDSAFYDLLTSKPSEVDSLLDMDTYNEHRHYMRSDSSIRAQRLKRSLSLDDLVLAESIEDDFLNMLSIDHDQGLDRGSSILDSDLIAKKEEFCSFTPTGKGKVVDLDLSVPIQGGERNRHNLHQSVRNNRSAEMLENLETEALMHQWGLTENAFQYSPRMNSGGFGSPVYLPMEEPLQLPPIVEGKGPIVKTKDGGYLRSMNPLLFRKANNGARLIVQVSAPVLFPSAMGSTAMEMLRCWACVGVEKMCLQANELMPLEDVTGKMMQQFLAEEQESDGVDRSCAAQNSCSDIVSIEDLVPMAIKNIESLLLEGLKIHSSMADQEPPSSINIHLGGISTSRKKASEASSNFGFPIFDANELTKCSLSLEEWLKLDSDNFRMVLKVQLRDPMRDYETVGPPMLALAQVNLASYSPPQPPMFKVSEAHLAGFNVGRNGNKPFWGTTRQHQSGSRWLLSSGMARSNKKNIVSNTNIVVRSSYGVMKKAQNQNVLWSVSVPIEGEAAATWDERIALNVHVRNPDLILPSDQNEQNLLF